MNDMNKDENCRGITCKSHSARSERADIYRICPSKLSKRELEDMYFALLENNLDLKRTINGQKDKIKVLSTKVHRITTAQKNGIGKEQTCCAHAKAIICEQKESIADLKKANGRMMERIRLLNMRLCSAKQFLKCAPDKPVQQSTSRCMNRCVTATPTTTSLKNCSSTAITTKGSDGNLKPVAVSCDDFDKDEACVKSVKTETSEQEKEDPNKPCDQNRCQTVMEELKQKIVNLQEELSKSRSEYSSGMSRVEREMSFLREENARVLSAHARAADGLRARDQRAEDLAAKLRGAEAHYSELALQLCLERKRVAELETRIRAEQMSCQIVKTMHEHISNIHAETETSSEPQQNVARSNDMQTTKESLKESVQTRPCLSPINATTSAWEASTPQSVPSTCRSGTGIVARNIIGNDENKTVKCADDSGFGDLSKTQDIEEEKNTVNQILMKRMVCLQNQLENLKDSAAEKSNDPGKLNTKSSDVNIAQKNETTPTINTSDGQRFKLYNESSDTVIQQYDAQKKCKEPTSISVESQQKDNEDKNIADRQIKLYNESSDTIIQEYNAQKTGKESKETTNVKPGKFAYQDDKSLDDQLSTDYNQTVVQPYVAQKNDKEPTAVTDPKKDVNVDTNYFDDLKYMNELEISSKYSTHMSAQHIDKNLTFNENEEQENADKRKSTVIRNWQYPAEQSPSKATKNVKQGGNFDSELSVLVNNKNAIKSVEAPSTKKGDNHNSYQIPGPISASESRTERKSLRQIFVDGINKRKYKETRVSKDVVNTVSAVARNSISMKKNHPELENNESDDIDKTLDNLKSIANTAIISTNNPENKTENVDVVCPNDLQKRPKEKSLSFEDDQKAALEKTTKNADKLTSSNAPDHKDEENQVSDDKVKASNKQEIYMPVENIQTSNASSMFPDDQYKLPLYSNTKKENFQQDEQSQIKPSTLQPEADQTEPKEDNDIGIQTAQPDGLPEQNARGVSKSPPLTYTLNLNEMKCTRATSPENTDCEISSLADLPSDKESKSPRGAISPGEDKATTTYTDSYSTPTTTEYCSLSEGELPGAKRNQPSQLASKEKDNVNPTPSNISTSQKMEAALQAITEELARCRQLLMNQTSAQEQSKSDSKDVSTSVELANERLALKKTPASPRIGDTIVPKCVFTLHIGTVVLSDEAVMNSRNMTLVLMWKFYDQNMAMTRMRTGRVILFDFSTEYDVRMTDEFLNYLKYEEMPIMVCEIDKQDEPFASCALPLRDALLNTNRRTDMSLALVAGPHMTRALTAADALDAGDEVGVVDLWCVLRADIPPGSPPLNQLITRINSLPQPDTIPHEASMKYDVNQLAKDAPQDYSQLGIDFDVDAARLPSKSSTQIDMGDSTVTKDYNSQPSRNITSQNNYLGNTRFPVNQLRRSSINSQKTIHSTELKEKRPVGFQNDKMSLPYRTNIMTSELLVNEIPAHIRSTEELKKALQRNVNDKNRSSATRLPNIEDEVASTGSLKGTKKQFQKTKWFDRPDPEDDETQDYSGFMKETRRTSKDSQGFKYIKDDGSDENLSKKNDSTKSPKSVTIVPKPEKRSSKCEERQKCRSKDYRRDKYSYDDDNSIAENEDPGGTQSLTITVLWLALNEECEAMVDPKVQRLYVAYTFLGKTGAELETPVSLPKPKHYVDKCCFNFSKTFQLHDCDLPLLGHMARCRSSNRMSGDPRDCIVFTVISEPPEDPLGLDSCEDVGYAQLYLGDMVAYSAGNGEYTEVVPVRAAAGDVVGVLAVRVSGLHVVRRCMALSHSHRDLTHYWDWSLTMLHYTMQINYDNMPRPS